MIHLTWHHPGVVLEAKHVNSASSPSTTQKSITTSTTSSAPVTSGTSGLASDPCPAKNQTTIRASTGSLFSVLCSVDWPKGIKSADGRGKVQDLEYRTEYSLEDCIGACVDYNQDRTKDTCKGVTYSANLTASFDGGQGGNCFLKDRIGSYFATSDTTMCAGLVGG